MQQLLYTIEHILHSVWIIELYLEVILMSSPKEIVPKSYSRRETLGCLWRNVAGPSKSNPGGVQFLPKETMLNSIEKKAQLGLIGDIMDMHEKNLIITSEAKSFFKTCDALIGNFEATITDLPRKGFDQRNDEKILDSLSDLFPPEKTFLSVANNHAGDFGYRTCQDSISKLKTRGFHVFGLRDTPFVDITKDIRIFTGTQWSERVCEYVAPLSNINVPLTPSTCNLLFPHWGYEIELYPRTQTIEQALSFLTKFDAIIGHHPHVPQPISQMPKASRKQLVAYSLGDFCSGLRYKNYLYGEVITVELGLNSSGEWSAGSIQWSFSKCSPQAESEHRVTLVEHVPFF
jgi:hypothetical protein